MTQHEKRTHPGVYLQPVVIKLWDQCKILISSFTALYTNLQYWCDRLRSSREMKQGQPKHHLSNATPAKAAGQAGMCAETALQTAVPRLVGKAVGKGCEGRALLCFHQNKKLGIPGPPFCHPGSLMAVTASATYGLEGSKVITKDWERWWSDLHIQRPSCHCGAGHWATQEIKLQT